MTNDDNNDTTPKVTHKRGGRGTVWEYRPGKWGYILDNGRDKNGQRRQITKKGFPGKKEAQTALNALLTTMDEGTNVGPDKITFGAYFSQWRESHGELKWASSTRETSKRRAQYAVRLFGHIQLQKLSEEMIESGLVRLHRSGGLNGKPLSTKTVRAVAALVNQCLEKAYRRDKIAKNPMLNVELPKMPQTEPKKPTEDQYERLLERVSETRYHAFIVFAADSGLRRGEQVALQWSDINFETGEVTISKSLSVTREGGWEIKPPKSGKPRSHIVSESTLNILRGQRAMIEREKELFGSDYKDNDLVFCKEDGTYYSPDRVTNRVSEFMRECGCDGLSLHKLRHFSASYYLSRGVPIATVSERLGHADSAITLRIYAHSLPSDDRRAADLWDRTMGERVEQSKNPGAEAKKPAKLALVSQKSPYVTQDVTQNDQILPKLFKIKG